MNREDIYFMAKQVGIDSVEQYDSDTSPLELLERFAKLVEEHERDACAKACEETTASWTQHLYNEGCIDCAKAIRARGNT
jgi:hypothetical protein